MANLSHIKARGPNGAPTWRIQFNDGDGERRAIYLGRVSKKVADVWMRHVAQLIACSITGTPFDTDLSVWLRDVPDALYEKLVKVGLVKPRLPVEPQLVTLSFLTQAFIERSTGKPATIRGFKQTLDSLLEFFGGDRPLNDITAEEADKWRAWVAMDKKGSGRHRKKRTTGDNRLAPPTVAKRVSVAKQVFQCAVRWEWLAKSPFDGLRAGSQANPTRARYVSLETIRDVLEACPSIDWKLIVALARLAGLRCPSEVGTLTWGSVNWEKGRLTVLATKTEHHGGDHAVRVVPICPELRVILADAFERAEPGATLLVPLAARSSVNLRTHLERIIAKAGHETWPRLLQNLRASCETDWVERYPSHVVAKWLGHSPKIAAAHYLMSREHHFEDVIAGGSKAGTSSVPGDPMACDANCDSLATQIATLQGSATVRNEPHKTTEPAATIQVAAGSSVFAPVTKTGQVAGTGFEPATSRL